MELSEIISYFATSWTLAVANVQYETYKIKKPQDFRLEAFDFCSGEQDRTADLRVMNPTL